MDRKRLMQPPFQIHLTEGVEILVTLIGAHYNFMDHIAKRMQHFCLYTEHFFCPLRFGTFISPGVIILNMILTRQKRVSVDRLAMWSSCECNIIYCKLCNIRMRFTYCKFISPGCTILHLAVYIATGLLNVYNMCTA